MLSGLASAGAAQQPQPASTPAQPAVSVPSSAPAEKPSPSDQTASSAKANPKEPTAKDANGIPNVDPARYVIGPEDALQITVWREPSLSGSFPVRPDGMISMVLVGDMPAAGRTPMQLADEISERLKKYLQDPTVSVVVQGVNSQRIYLMGEVGHVGPINLLAGMGPLQAIAAAGGLGPFANSKKIYILRNEGSGKPQKIPFNYKQALKGDDAQGIKLQPGDTIVVP
jgi:polysaccharide export outer membrane protein